MGSFAELEKVLARWREPLLKKRNVMAVGLGFKVCRGRTTGVPAILVYVTRKVPLKDLPQEERVPPVIEGWATDVVEASEIRFFSPVES